MGKKKTFSTRIDDERLKALKHLAVDTDKSLGKLLEEAIEDLIHKYKKMKKWKGAAIAWQTPSLALEAVLKSQIVFDGPSQADYRAQSGVLKPLKIKIVE